MSRPRATTDPFAIIGANDPNGDTQPSMESAGGRLRREREAQRISEKEAAHTLRLMVTDLRAIEADRYSASANDDLLRSHLRDYANLLTLNPDSILAIYDRQAGTRLHRGANRIDDIPRAKMTGFGSLLTGSLVVMTVVLGFLVLMQFTNTSRVNALLAETSNSQEVDLQKIDDTGVSAAAIADSEPAAVTHGEEKDSVQAATEIKLVSADATEAATKAADEIAEQADAGAVTEVAAAYRNDSSASATAVTADGEAVDELSFRFAKDCWVEVYDADEQRLVAEIRKAGGSLQLSGKSPFKVLVGYSREVVLQFNGHPVDIEKIDRSYSTLFTVARPVNDTEAPVVTTIRRKLPDNPGKAPPEVTAENSAPKS